MSEQIRHTLLNHEVPPPPAAWEHILSELREMEAYKTTGHQLAVAEVNPAPHNWNRILSGLEEISIGQQLANTEVTPPHGTWDKIARELDTEQQPIKRITPWWRYAAAAAILVTIGLGIMRMVQPGVKGEEMALHQDTLPVIDPGKSDLTKETLDELVATASAENEDARNDAALEASKKTYAKLEYPAKKIAREVSGFYFNTYSGDAGTRGLTTGETVLTEHKPAERYIKLMTPEGNIIRVSKKLGGMVCCLSGEAEDPACTDQLKKWREKMITSSLGHSGDSFLDLLLLINTEEEN